MNKKISEPGDTIDLLSPFSMGDTLKNHTLALTSPDLPTP